MLLERLREYAETRLVDTLPPAMYQPQPIRYVVALDAAGRFLGIRDQSDPTEAKTKRGKTMLAPYVKRGYDIRPKLLADTGEYVFGLTKIDPKKERNPDRIRQGHELFVELARSCAAATRDPAVEAVARFLEQVRAASHDLPRTIQLPGGATLLALGMDPDLLELPADFDPSEHLTFQVGEVMPIDLPAVRSYWARQFEQDDAASDAVLLECIVCGERRPALRRHPLKIKGIRKGQSSGTDLISANKNAFESYGLQNSLIAPTCQECAEKYGNALNALLSSSDSHLHVAGVEYLFWTKQRSGFSPVRLLSQPDASEVRELLKAAWSGQAKAAEIQDEAFYAMALGASGGRAAVLAWIDTTIGEAKRWLANYFALQELVGLDGSAGAPLPIWQLAGATVRDPNKESPPEMVPAALLQLALTGTPPPMDLLYLAVQRNRAEQSVTRPRAVLIKLVLGSQEQVDGERSRWMAELDLSNREPAYLCGRLLAVLDAIQSRALGNPNTTIVDRFYGSASSAPASVFGTLLHGAQAHLSKLRKDERSRGAYLALERRLEEILEPLREFPATLTLQEQGLFALGFYHQRAADRRARQERAAEREDALAPAPDAADEAGEAV
jgi:CRISPR-associated protein Csd1